MEKVLTCVAAIGMLVACSSTTEAPFACALGELTGTWQIAYSETDGNCGKLATETVVFSPGAVAEAKATCKYDSQAVSADKCRIDLDYTCPLTTGSGSQRWTGAMHQTAAGTVTGSMTVQATAGGQACRSTYDVTWTRQ